MIDEVKKCVNPVCEHEPLAESPAERSWTMRKYYCPKCNRPYGVPTTVGKVAQVSPLAIASVVVTGFAISILTGDDGDTVDHLYNLD